MENDSVKVIIGIIIVFILFFLSVTVYYDSNRHNNLPLSSYDTIRNIFGFFDIIGEDILDSTANIVTETEKVVDNLVKKEHKLEKIIKDEKEVFNIDNNEFTYEQAPEVCKALGAELATYEQVKNAYNDGAHWCNYGWTDNQMALYPIQKGKFKRMTPKRQMQCGGKPGINGGYFNDTSLKFGVNCYGIKKDPDPAKIIYKDEATQKEELINDINISQLDIRPFNQNKWSEYSKKNSSYIINPRHQKPERTLPDINKYDTTELEGELYNEEQYFKDFLEYVRRNNLSEDSSTQPTPTPTNPPTHTRPHHHHNHQSRVPTPTPTPTNAPVHTRPHHHSRSPTPTPTNVPTPDHHTRQRRNKDFRYRDEQNNNTVQTNSDVGQDESPDYNDLLNSIEQQPYIQNFIQTMFGNSQTASQTEQDSDQQQNRRHNRRQNRRQNTSESDSIDSDSLTPDNIDSLTPDCRMCIERGYENCEENCIPYSPEPTTTPGPTVTPTPTNAASF